MMIIIMIFMLRETLTILLKLQAKYVLCVCFFFFLGFCSLSLSGLYFFFAICSLHVRLSFMCRNSLMSFHAVCAGCVADTVFSQILLSSFLVQLVFWSMMRSHSLAQLVSLLCFGSFYSMRSDVLTNSIYVSVT